MKKNKLFYLFASLSKTEANRFGKYVRHSLFNTQQKVILLVDFLIKNLEGAAPEKYEEIKQKAFKKIFPKAKDNNIKMRLLMSNTFALLNDFLVFEELKATPLQRDKLLRDSLWKRKLTAYHQVKLDQAKKSLDKASEQDFYYHREMLDLRHDFYFKADSNKYSEKDLLENLSKINTNLDAAYLMAKMHYACQMLSIQRIRGTEAKISFLDEIIAMAKTFEGDRLMQLYLRLIALIQESTEAEFYRLQQEMYLCFPLFGSHLRHHLFEILINLSWFSVDRLRWPTVVFELYTYGLEYEMVLENGILATSHFNNIVDIGCSLKRFDEVRQIIKNYLPSLEVGDDLAENVQTLYESFLYFGENKHEKVIAHLNYLEFSDFTYGVRAYLLMIKSLYETKKDKGFQEIDTRCDSFKQYINRKYKQGYLNKVNREENLNFVKIVRQLPYASGSQYAKITAADLNKQLDAMERVVGRAWLKGKILEL